VARPPVWRSPPSIYEALPPNGSVLFEFPVHLPPDRFSENLPYMYFSMWHWRPMVNGYSGFIPASYMSLVEGISTFPDTKALQYLAGVGVTHIAVLCRLWEADVCGATLNRLDATPAVRRLVRAEWYGAPSVLYEIRRDSGIRGAGFGMRDGWPEIRSRSASELSFESRIPDPAPRIPVVQSATVTQ
jgi:hypothetical protein